MQSLPRERPMAGQVIRPPPQLRNAGKNGVRSLKRSVISCLEMAQLEAQRDGFSRLLCDFAFGDENSDFDVEDLLALLNQVNKDSKRAHLE